MNASTIAQLSPLLAVIEAGGIPALRVVFTIALLAILAVGLFIYRRRHLFFDRDPDVPNDFSIVRHMRMENIIFVWGALTMVLFCICVEVWRT
jgi:hypothetical protein